MEGNAEVPRRTGRRGPSARAGLGLAVLATLLLSGCGAQLTRGYLPDGVTEHEEVVTGYWNGMWIAALAVGVLVWGLMLWCIVRYRRRRNDVGLPEQMRYNVPIEILYTVVPVFMVAVLFAKNVEVESELLDTSAEPDVIVNVAGKQWSWDFNYVLENVHEAGVQANSLNAGEPGLPELLPRLVLPVDSRVEFVLTSRDVIHSFWVPQFLMKLDMMPGYVNTFQVVTTEEGSFMGKCAELCGAYHSEMLFRVDVVPQEEYEVYIAELQAQGQTGLLGTGLNRELLIEGEQELLPAEMRDN